MIAADDGYLPGGGELRDALPEAQGEFAHGHDRATCGSLTPEEFELLVERLNL